MVCDGPRAAGPRGREGVDVASGGARAIPTEAQQTDACGSRFGPTSAPAHARTAAPPPRAGTGSRSLPACGTPPGLGTRKTGSPHDDPRSGRSLHQPEEKSSERRMPETGVRGHRL